MDLSRFAEEDWAHVRARIARREGNLDEKSFLAWLLAEGREEKLIAAKGENWTLGEALTMATGGGPKTTSKRRVPRIEEGKFSANPVMNMHQEDGTPVYENVPIGAMTKAKMTEMVDARVALYEDSFVEIEPNDRALIRSLAMTEVSAEQINMLLQDEYLASTPNADRIQKLNSALKGANETAVSFQKMLGIDRITRDKNREERQDVDVVMDVIDAAGAYVEEHGIRVEHCGVLIGYWVTDFLEYGSTVTVEHCSECGEPVTVVHIPSAEDLKALEPGWVAKEEEKFSFAYRTEDE